MSRTIPSLTLISATLCLLLSHSLLPPAVHAADDAGESLKLGAQLYDNWPKLKAQSFEASHPLYPESSKKRGTSTWRCKECHGWDYLGNEGRYSTGSHYTGIAGLLEAKSHGADRLSKSLTDDEKGHDFSAYLSSRELEALTMFLELGVVDGRRWIEGGGNPDSGRQLYDQNCADCHGSDGRELDFKPGEKGTQGVGWLARKNPQETLHKIRWGHPGSDMPSLIGDAGLAEADAGHILQYATDLP